MVYERIEIVMKTQAAYGLTCRKTPVAYAIYAIYTIYAIYAI